MTAEGPPGLVLFICMKTQLCILLKGGDTYISKLLVSWAHFAHGLGLILSQGTVVTSVPTKCFTGEQGPQNTLEAKLPQPISTSIQRESSAPRHVWVAHQADVIYTSYETF